MKIRRGFTLLELLVSMAIIGMIMTAATVSFRGILRATQQTEAALDIQFDMDRAWFLIEDDLLNIRWRSAQNEFSQTEAALICAEYGDSALSLTRAGGRVSFDDEAVALNSSLSRVSYELRAEELYRIHWRYPDRSDDKPQKRLLLDQISDFSCKVIKQAAATTLSEDTPPAGIEITLESQRNGRFPRVFFLGLNRGQVEKKQ